MTCDCRPGEHADGWQEFRCEAREAEERLTWVTVVARAPGRTR